MLYKIDAYNLNYHKTFVFKKFITELQKEKIRVLWNEEARNKNEEALLNFVFKITKAKIILLDHLLKGKATKLIVALERMD